MLSIARYDLFEIFFDTGKIPIGEFSYDGQLQKSFFNGGERLTKIYLKDSAAIIQRYQGQYETMILYDQKGCGWTVLPFEKSLVLIGPVQTSKTTYFPYQGIPEYSWDSYLAIATSFSKILLGKETNLKVCNAPKRKETKEESIYDKISGFNYEWKSFDNIYECIKTGDLSSLQTILDTNELPDYLDRVIENKEAAKRVFEFAVTKAYHSAQASCGAIEELTVLTNQYLSAEYNYRTIAAYRTGLMNMFYDFTKLVFQLHSGNYSSLVNQIMIYINEHLYNQIDVSELAAHCMFSASTLQHQFKEETGKTITQMIRQKKIEKSCFFLKHTNLPCSDIATKMGYCSQSYYISQFKVEKGMTPSEYRRSGICK